MFWVESRFLLHFWSFIFGASCKFPCNCKKHCRWIPWALCSVPSRANIFHNWNPHQETEFCFCVHGHILPLILLYFWHPLSPPQSCSFFIIRLECRWDCTVGDLSRLAFLFLHLAYFLWNPFKLDVTTPHSFWCCWLIVHNVGIMVFNNWRSFFFLKM